GRGGDVSQPEIGGSAGGGPCRLSRAHVFGGLGCGVVAGTGEQLRVPAAEPAGVAHHVRWVTCSGKRPLLVAAAMIVSGDRQFSHRNVRDSVSAAVRTAGATCSVRIRFVQPEMDSAPTAFPAASSSGLAAQTTPIPDSSCS